MPQPLHRSFWLIIFISSLAYYWLAYDVARHETSKLLFGLFFIFVTYAWIVWKRAAVSLKEILVAGILLRLVIFISFPSLSDDFYRFIWDGKLWLNGINPFLETPEFYIGQGLPGLNERLFGQLNSPNTFTVYPPVAQLSFVAAAAFDSLWQNVFVMRLFALAADVGTVWALLILLKRRGLSSLNVAVYVLNPLIILEFVGNLHHEGIMICFLLWTIIALQDRRIFRAASFFGLAVATKLIPLIFAPLIWMRLGMKQGLKFTIMMSFVVLVLFYPMLNMDVLKGMGTSLELYFQNFEFNASIYYLVRFIGFQVKGYNIIGTAGFWLAVASFSGIIVFSVWAARSKMDTAESFLWILMIYLSLTTILHPWYIAPILVFGILRNYWFPVIWTLLIMLTYSGYSISGFEENILLLWIEYVMLVLLLAWELYFRPKYRPIQQ